MTYRNKKESEKGIKLSGGKCVVCNWDKKDREGNSLIEGAHVKGFETGAECDKYDNIIALCPNHHKEFDALNFYIDADTNKLFFCYDCEFDGKDISDRVRHIQKRYLLYQKYLYDKKNV